MKPVRILIAAITATLFSTIFGALTCGGLFNWIYTLEPTHVWKPMDGPPGLTYLLGGLIINGIITVVYAVLKKGIPGKNAAARGCVFGLCVWAVGTLPGMFATYSFMTVATGVVIYWTLLGLVEVPLKGMIVALIYGE